MSVKKVPFYEDPGQLNKKIREALQYYELPEEITVYVLQEWINETNNPVLFITRVFNEAHFASEVEAEKLLDLLTRLWNATPRRELGGISPQQKLGVGNK
jgi:hypothetical protein